MAKSKNNKAKIIEAYFDFLLEKKVKPTSIYSFCKLIHIEEKEFYQHYSSFDNIDAELWNNFHQTTIDKLTSEKVFAQYSGREKLLAFYYTFIEVLKENRSYVQLMVNKNRIFGPLAPFLKDTREHFNSFVKNIIEAGVAIGEVEDRKMLTDKYYLGFWMQFVFVLDFWVKDTSDQFEKTDAAIEKAVNLSFDLLGKNPIDSLFDFGKFVVQSKWMGK